MKAIYTVECSKCGEPVERCSATRRAVCFDCKKAYIDQWWKNRKEVENHNINPNSGFDKAEKALI